MKHLKHNNFEIFTDGEGPTHYGVCSSYLQDVPVGEEVYSFIRGAPNFHLPTDSTKPIVLVGPGTGIAPFRSFWQQRLAQVNVNKKVGKIWLFFGCRTSELDLYKDEKQEMVNRGVLDRVFLALSREPNVPKVCFSKYLFVLKLIPNFTLDLRSKFGFKRRS